MYFGSFLKNLDKIYIIHLSEIVNVILPASGFLWHRWYATQITYTHGFLQQVALRFCDMGRILSPPFVYNVVNRLFIAIDLVCIYANHYRKLCMCRMRTAIYGKPFIKSQISPVNYAVQALYNLCWSPNIWVKGPTVSPGGICFTKFRNNSVPLEI